MSSLILPMQMIVVFSLAVASTEARSEPWQDTRKNCYDVHTPGFDSRYSKFKQLMVDGNKWDADLDQELKGVNDLINTTCREWARSPNGDGILAKFSTQYQALAAKAVSLRGDAVNKYLANLTTWENLQRAEVAELRSEPSGAKYLSWDKSFKCSKYFVSLKSHVQARKELLKAAFVKLEKNCPKLPNGTPATSSVNLSNPQNSGPSRVVVPSESDISGTKPDQKK